MTTSAAFTAAASMPERFDFTAEVAQFYADFPDEIGRVYFVEIDDQKITYFDPPGYKTISPPLQVAGYVANYADDHALGESGSTIQASNGTIWILVRRQNQITAQRLFQETYTFDHEVGHAKCHYGRPETPADRNRGECVADAYAALRHIQRFGKDTVFLSSESINLIQMLFTDKQDMGTHFTSPVIDALNDIKNVTDFSRMSPHETARVASRYALAHAPDFWVLQDAVRAMPDFGKQLDDQTIDRLEITRRMALHILDSDNPYTRLYGYKLITPFLDNRKRLRNQTGAIPHDDAWTNIRQRFAALGQECAALNIPKLTSTPKTPANTPGADKKRAHHARR